MGWGALKMSVELDDKKISSQMMTLENQISKTADNIGDIQAELDKLGKTSVKTQIFADTEKQIEASEKRLTKFREQMQKLQETGRGDSTTAYDKQYDIDKEKAKLEQLQMFKASLVKSGQDFEIKDESDKIDKLSKKLEYAKNNMQVLLKKHDVLSAKQKQVGNQGQKQYSLLSDTLQKVISKIVKLGIRVLIFSQITKAFRAMIANMKEGLQSLSQFSNTYNTNMSNLTSRTVELKNNLASMVEPILNSIIPALTTLVGWLNRAVEAITKFLSVLSGKNTYTKATTQVLNYAKGVAQASKETKNAVASFDDVNVLQQNNSSSGSGATTGADAFEEVEIDDSYIEKIKKLKEMLQPIKDLLMQILPYALAVGTAIALFWGGAELVKFLGGLMSVNTFFQNLAGILLVIVGLFIAILSYVDMWKNGLTTAGIVEYFLGLAIAVAGLTVLFGSVAGGIALLIGGIAGLVLAIKDISENGLTAKNVILLIVSALGVFIGLCMIFGLKTAIIITVFTAIIGLVALAIKHFDKSGEALGHLKDAFAKLGDFVSKVFAGDLEGAFEDLKDAGRSFGNFFISIAESMANAFVGMVNHVVDALNKLSWDVPDWLEDLTGMKTFGFNLPHWNTQIKFPRLANGGITTGSTLANIGEAGREAVLPLENNTGWMEDLASKMVEYMSINSQDRTVIMQIDGKEFARTSLPFINAENARIGVSLAKG